MTRKLPEVFADPLLLHQRVVDVERPGSEPIRLLDAPFRLSGAPDLVRSAPPLPGQHSDAMLGWLGATGKEAGQWRAAGVR